MKWTISAGRRAGNRGARRAGGFTILELLVVVAILSIIMAMVGYVMVKALELKSVSENRLDDLVGGLAAGRLLERDLRGMPEYSDPTTAPASLPRAAYFLDRVTIDGKVNQPVLYLKTTDDRFDPRSGDTEYVRWYVKGGVLCREVLDLKTNAWLDLNTVTDLDLAPFEVLRGVAWTVEFAPFDATRLEVLAEIYPSMVSYRRVEVQGEPPDGLANNERPRSVQLQFHISQAALTGKLAQESFLP